MPIPKEVLNSSIPFVLSPSIPKRVAWMELAESGHLPIDNNPTENCIRPIAVGKKNWLFVGSQRAGQRAAAIQTLLGTAKLSGPEQDGVL